MRIRVAVRALIIDPDDRVLLVLLRLPHVDVWATPGGGIEAGEQPLEALRRELVEETGYVDVEIGPAIWTKSSMFSLTDEWDGQFETFYLVRVDTPEPGTPSLTDGELRAELLVDRAWWTIDELHASSAEFTPRRLSTLVSELLANGPPERPIDLGSEKT